MKIELSLLALLAAQVDPEAYVDMQYIERVDPINDAKTIIAIAGNKRDQVSVTCSPRSNSIRVVFTTKQIIPKTGLLTAAHSFTYRFDSDKPVTRDWYYDEGIVDEFGNGTTIPFIRRLLTAKQIAIRGSSIFGSEPVEAVLPLGDTRTAVVRVLQACPGSKPTRTLASELAAQPSP